MNEMELQEEIEKILYKKDHPDRWKYDKLLEIDACNYTNLGTDSTKTEKQAVRKTSRKIYKAIKGLKTTITEGVNVNEAERLGNDFLKFMD